MVRLKLASLVLGIALLFSVGLNIYHFVIGHGAENLPSGATVVQTMYPFLSPRLALSDRNDIFLNFSSLRQGLRAYISAQEKPIYLYFEYLPSGTSIGINEQQEIPSASLIKIPTVMAVYEKIDKKELSLDQVLTVQQQNLDPDFGTFWKEGVGATITLKDAIEKTIVDSDNTTHNLIYNLIKPEDRLDVFNQLDIAITKEGQIDKPLVTAKSYSSILKSLYYSTYLSFESSNAILETMTRITDNSKLPAGIDTGVKVAHKIGVYERVPGDYFYNDCGIVYPEKRKYVLCIMVNSSEEEAKIHMKELSRMVYAFIKRIDIPYTNPSVSP